MCWRCVSDSVPYVMGSVVAVRAYGVRLGRAARRDRDEPETAGPTTELPSSESSNGRPPPSS